MENKIKLQSGETERLSKLKQSCENLFYCAHCILGGTRDFYTEE